jgi:phage/plasmid-associated DNA primase
MYLRAFYPPTDPRKNEDKGRKAEAANLDKLIAHATRFQNEGRGVYLVVNGGGQTKKDVTTGRAIFYEHDNLDKAAQLELWKTLGLPEPTFQVDTGGKSIHSYWVFDEPVAIEKWVLIQKDLLDFADADRTIKDPSRVMRLAGAWHSSGNQSLIINNSGKRYTYDELREVIPEPKQPEAKQPKLQLEATSNKPNSYKDIEVPVSMPAPILCALGKNSKELLDGVSIERNNSMAALARDLLGVESEFRRLGQSTNDDAHTLFIDACRNCSPGDGWDENEWNQIWEYAQTQNPTASNSKASPDAVENCIKGWYWQLHKPIQKDSLQRHSNNGKPSDDRPGFNDDIPAGIKKEFNQQALDFLFGDKPWICADNKLYFWTGTHYQYSPDSEQRPRISSYCNSFVAWKKETKSLGFPFANPAAAKQVLEWAKMRLEVNSDLLNPPGLNCTNGVLQLHWEATAVRLTPIPKWELIPHTPDLYYTFEPFATYNPEADPQHCDRLMQALNAPQQDIFLKTIAASLDLETVRKYKGRMVKGVLNKGDGSNGKDTLRELVSLMYGHQGMTAATLSDFAAYDEGRKFPLARTANSRVNWASENAQTARLDKIQSLKAFITGDTLSRERKGEDEKDFIPKAIAIFNCNDTPNMQGSLEAIKSRYAVLTFDKTFKVDADPTRGEIEAEPRFKYDPEFLKTEVLPAFLNKVLNALGALMTDGIDYTATEAAMAAIQAENSHLFQFSQDTGLDYSPDDSLTASDIWTRLETWYQDNGTLVYETASNDKVKALWLDQPRRGDSNVKGVNQVLARIQQLFPKATRTTVYNATSKRSVAALSGIGFVDTRTSSAPVPHHHPHQENLTNQDLRTTRTSFSNSEQNQKKSEEDDVWETDNRNEYPEKITAKTVKPAETGAGGAEPLEIKDFSCGSGAGIGAGEVETGAGGIEKPIAPPSSATATAQEFAEQIRKAIANVDRSPAIEVWNAIAGKAKTELREAVENFLAPSEANNFRLLAKAGFIKGTRVKYIGTRFSEQYQGVELRVSSMDEYFEISCLKPDGSGYTTRLKPEELEIIR